MSSFILFSICETYCTLSEPLPMDNVLRTMPNVMMMPHSAGPSFDMREKVVLQLLADVLAAQEGKPCRTHIPYDYAVRMTVN